MSSDVPEYKTLPDVPPAYSTKPILVNNDFHQYDNRPQESAPLLMNQPPDYLWMSIFSIVCCFWPVGILALIKSLNVSNSFDAGKYSDALSASHEAKKYNKMAILIGLLIHVLVWLFCVVVPGIMAVVFVTTVDIPTYNTTTTSV